MMPQPKTRSSSCSGRLHDADLLVSDSRPDSEQADRRREKVLKSKRAKYAKSPLTIRVPLANPDRWLDRLDWLSKLCFNRVAAIVWCALLLSALSVAASHFDNLLLHAKERALSAQNILVLVLAFPLMKLLSRVGTRFSG